MNVKLSFLLLFWVFSINLIGSPLNETNHVSFDLLDSDVNEPGVVTLGATWRWFAYPAGFSCVFFSFLSKIRGEGEVNEAIHEELHPLNLKRKYDDNRNLDIVILNEPYPKP